MNYKGGGIRAVRPIPYAIKGCPAHTYLYMYLNIKKYIDVLIQNGFY